jgi:hypothetical protein
LAFVEKAEINESGHSDGEKLYGNVIKFLGGNWGGY